MLPVLAAAALLPAGPGGSALAEDGSGEAAASEFEVGFARYDQAPRPYVPATHAVDITDIEPPLEAEEERAIRSLGTGGASFYGRRFHGRRTANGERFDMHGLTAAHRTLPFGSLVRVTNPRNGLSVTVRINDRGPFHGNRVIDLSRAAASEIGLISRGHGVVELELVEG